jgi:hypothetical protein
MPRTKTRKPKLAPAPWSMDFDIDGAFDTCGSSAEELRACVLAQRRSARWLLDAELYRALTRRGYAAQDLCAPELSARLVDVTVADLLQAASMGRKDAIITVYHGSLESRVWCSGGEIVDARAGRLEGESAVYRMLALDDGDVLADYRPVRRRRAILRSTQALMLDAIRYKKECGAIEKQLGSTLAVYESVPGARAAVEPGSLDAELLQAFSGGACVDSVLAASAIDDLTVLHAVSKLVRRGDLVARADAPRRPSSSTRPRSVDATALRGKVGSSMRAWRLFAVIVILGISATFIASIFETPEEVVAIHTTEMPLQSATGALHETAEATPRSETTVTPERQRSTASSLPHASSSPPSAPTANGIYQVEVTAEPARAEFWLDGERVAIGYLSMALERDGRTHELHVRAPAHRAQTHVFSDTPPPRAVILEPSDTKDREGRDGAGTVPPPASERTRLTPRPSQNPTTSLARNRTAESPP